MTQALNKWELSVKDLKLTKPLGRGTFGVVWLGDYKGTPVAVKKLMGLEKEDAEKYIGREIDALTQLAHPNIVQLLGMAITSDTIFIVTDYVEGGDLHSKLIDPAWKFNWKRRVCFLLDITRAMVYLHATGIHEKRKTHGTEGI